MRTSPLFYIFGQFPAAYADNLMVLDAGATADAVCFKWPGHHNPARARF